MQKFLFVKKIKIKKFFFNISLILILFFILKKEGIFRCSNKPGRLDNF